MHLEQGGYHPRSDKHSNALAAAVVADLLDGCAPIRERARSGELVYDINRKIYTGTADWNIDLVLGAPPGGPVAPPANGIARTPPSTIQIGVEIKAVMTEHKKAIRNRKRDFEAHHDHVHRYNDRAIAGGLMLINGAASFRSPLRALGITTKHRNPEALVRMCIDQMRAVTTRRGLQATGLDAMGVLVIEYPNLPDAKARYVTTGAAPQVGDPLHYDAFIQAICGHYRDRFS